MQVAKKLMLISGFSSWGCGDFGATPHRPPILFGMMYSVDNRYLSEKGSHVYTLGTRFKMDSLALLGL